MNCAKVLQINKELHIIKSYSRNEQINPAWKRLMKEPHKNLVGLVERICICKVKRYTWVETKAKEAKELIFTCSPEMNLWGFFFLVTAGRSSSVLSASQHLVNIQLKDVNQQGVNRWHTAARHHRQIRLLASPQNSWAPLSVTKTKKSQYLFILNTWKSIK